MKISFLINIKGLVAGNYTNSFTSLADCDMSSTLIQETLGWYCRIGYITSRITPNVIYIIHFIIDNVFSYITISSELCEKK